MPVILATWEGEIRRISVQSQLGQNSLRHLIPKNPTQNRAVGVAQVLEFLSSKRKALSSNPSTVKNKKPHLSTVAQITFILFR
jgi:hypothetical protein